MSSTSTNSYLVAAAPATPKHFTDEELKQQYGIHLATRLRADGDGKEAKWADIDDDEDDWAPETIEWNDGTKITLNDPSIALAEEQAAAAAAAALKQKQEEAAKAKKTVPKTITTIGPNATVLKLGSAAQPKIGGLVLKTPSDKPTLVAKPAAPAPVKSPWASLPPVDKVPPILPNSSMQPPPSRLTQKDPHGFDSMLPPPSPAMEIAADDFTRVRRDQTNTPGQLYNSQSGRYEPVNDTRRGSTRRDGNFRAPSLLQRSSPNDHHGPAEPSPAFQTHRSGSQQDGGSWSRRRASSNLSGDSGNQGRRASVDRSFELPRMPNEILQQRRGSQLTQSPLTPIQAQATIARTDSSIRSQSPATTISQQPNGVLSSNASPQQQKVGPSIAPTQPDPVLAQGQIIAEQKRLMLEKRDLAIKRKKDEEAREEAAKRERIRLKMESLGMPPLAEKADKKVERTAQPAQDEKLEAKQEPKVEIARRATTDPEKLAKKIDEEELTNSAKLEGSDIQTGILEVPALSREKDAQTGRSSIPDLGEDASDVYGKSDATNAIGKVTNDGAPVTAMPIGEVQPNPVSLQQNTQGPQEPKPDSTTATAPRMVNGDSYYKHANPPELSTVEPNNQTRRIGSQRQQQWKATQSNGDPYANWSGNGMTTHSAPGGNLWGPPSNHKALGNGTFDRNVPRVQSRQHPYPEQYMSAPPQPIGPPKTTQRSRASPETWQAADTSSLVVEDSQTIPSFPSPEAPPVPSTDRVITTAPAKVEVRPIQSMPQSEAEVLPQTERTSKAPDQVKSTLAAWGNFQATSARQDAEDNRKAAAERAARLAEEARTGVRQEPQVPVFNETWKQIQLDDQVGKRQIVGVSKMQHQTPDPIISQRASADIRNTLFTNAADVPINNGPPRSSRFFPGPGQGLHMQPHRVPSYAMGFSRSPSPPPPDSADHPAYARYHQRPLVNLPIGLKPKPIVKLPPSVVPDPTPPPIQVASLRAVPQPLVNNPSWQDRFNGLLGRRLSPEKKHAQVVDFSATKVPLEIHAVEDSAAVSIPHREEQVPDLSESGKVTSKEVEDEEALFEEREVGSKPTVLMPLAAPANAWNPAKAPNYPYQRGKGKGLKGIHKETDVMSIEPLVLGEHHSPNGVLIFINLLGMSAPKSKSLPVRKPESRGYQGHPHTVPRQRPVPMNPRSNKGFKPRESSGSFPPPRPAQNQQQRSQVNNGPVGRETQANAKPAPNTNQRPTRQTAPAPRQPLPTAPQQVTNFTSINSFHMLNTVSSTW